MLWHSVPKQVRTITKNDYRLIIELKGWTLGRVL